MIFKLKLTLALLFSQISTDVENSKQLSELRPEINKNASLPELMEAYGYKVDIDTTSYEIMDLAINN